MPGESGSKWTRGIAKLAAVIAAVWLFLQWQFPSCTFSYRLTVEVDTPEGVKTGSSVIEVSYHTQPTFLGNPSSLAVEVRSGEAVYIDIGRGKNLFVTLTRNESGRSVQATYENLTGALSPGMLPLAALGIKWGPGGVSTLCEKVERLRDKPPSEVPFDNLPTLVSFEDTSDPNTARVIQPKELTKQIGTGFALRRATLVIANDSLQEQIEQVLPWLPLKKAEWQNVVAVGKNEPLAKRLFYDAFKEPGLSGGER